MAKLTASILYLEMPDTTNSAGILGFKELSDRAYETGPKLIKSHIVWHGPNSGFNACYLIGSREEINRFLDSLGWDYEKEYIWDAPLLVALMIEERAAEYGGWIVYDGEKERRGDFANCYDIYMTSPADRRLLTNMKGIVVLSKDEEIFIDYTKLDSDDDNADEHDEKLQPKGVYDIYDWRSFLRSSHDHYWLSFIDTVNECVEIEGAIIVKDSDKSRAIRRYANSLCWYVLKYDVETTEYNNEIVFKTYNDALAEFNATKPSYDNERVELIFSPLDDGDNIMMEWKMR